MTITTPAATATHDLPSSPKAIVVNNLCALLVGSALMVFVHECVHWFTGVALGTRSTLYTFGVTHDDIAPMTSAITAIAAPVFSLASGLAFSFWQPFRRRGGYLHLVWLWFAFSSTQEGVTYLVIAPSGAGDTATFIRDAGLPGWIAVIFCLLGVAGMFLNARLFATPLVRHAERDILRMRSMAFFPWLLSIPFAVGQAFLYLSLAGMQVTTGEYIVILMAGLSTTVFAPMAFIFAKKVNPAPEPLVLKELPVAGIVSYLLVLIGNLALTRGIPLG